MSLSAAPAAPITVQSVYASAQSPTRTGGPTPTSSNGAFQQQRLASTWSLGAALAAWNTLRWGVPGLRDPAWVRTCLRFVHAREIAFRGVAFQHFDVRDWRCWYGQHCHLGLHLYLCSSAVCTIARSERRLIYFDYLQQYGHLATKLYLEAIAPGPMASLMHSRRRRPLRARFRVC